MSSQRAEGRKKGSVSRKRNPPQGGPRVRARLGRGEGDGWFERKQPRSASASASRTRLWGYSVAVVAVPRSVSLEVLPRGGSIVLQAKARGVVSVSVRSSGVGSSWTFVSSASRRHLPTLCDPPKIGPDSIGRGGGPATTTRGPCTAAAAGALECRPSLFMRGVPTRPADVGRRQFRPRIRIGLARTRTRRCTRRRRRKKLVPRHSRWTTTCTSRHALRRPVTKSSPPCS